MVDRLVKLGEPFDIAILSAHPLLDKLSKLLAGGETSLHVLQQHFKSSILLTLQQRGQAQVIGKEL